MLGNFNSIPCPRKKLRQPFESIFLFEFFIDEIVDLCIYLDNG